MKKIILLFFLLNSSLLLISQSVTISTTTNCFNPSVTIPYIFDLNGRPAFDTSTGNLGGFNPAQVSVLWSGSRWEILVGGGTLIYINNTNSPNPPNTGWQAFAPSFPLGTCSASDPAPTLSGDVSLPVELISFHATPLRDAIELYWTTASETNNDGFEIEKSEDGITWKKISFEEGKGTTDLINDYQYSDLNPLVGVNYYRLKQIDFDEKFEYSQIVATGFFQKKSHTTISPNPFKEKVKIELSKSFTIDTKIYIFNSLGKNMGSLIFEKDKTNQVFDVSNLKNGIYFFQITQSQSSSIHKIIKI
ncbi:MAG: T9SS type A sorting domain-containing protein [Saprospiraceae bacterium]